MLDEALALWRGAAYLEVADNEAVLPEATRVEELLADAAEMRAALLLVLGRADEAARSMERLMQQQPFREQPVALRMRALARQGRHAEALAVYERFRLTLGDELSIDPSPDLHRLEGEILRHDQPPPTPQIGLPGNALVGREVDLAAITSRLDAGRLVTLTGPGGVGKTRLALHAPHGSRRATRTVSGRASSPTSTPPRLWRPRCVRHCRWRGTPGTATPNASSSTSGPGGPCWSSTTASTWSTARRAWSPLSSPVHPTSTCWPRAAGGSASTASRSCPSGPWPCPHWDDPESPAVVLFVERARAVRPGFALTDDNTAAVCALCRRVDGLPLAVELAAARTVARTPAEILAEVTERLDRLGDPRRSRERHRSIDAVVARSYERLEPVEQQVFCSLAVFSGGFTAEAVASPAPTTTTLGYAGAPDAARAELAAVAGCPTVLAFCEYVGGEIRVDTDPGEALALFERARRTARTVGNRYLAAIAGVSAVSCAARAGDPTDALGGFAELLDYFDRTGSPAQQWTTIRSLIETLALL